MTAVRSELRWFSMHRAARTITTYQAKRGLLIGRWLFEPGARENPYPLFDQIRAEGRILDATVMKATADHALVSGILRDSESFSVVMAEAEGMPKIGKWLFAPPDPEIVSVIEAPSLLALDPPSHTRIRRQVTKPFTPRALQKVTDRVEERANQLLDGFAGRHEVDIVAEYANLLPVAVIAEILGIPEDMQGQFLQWGHAAAAVLDIGVRRRDFRTIMAALKSMNDWFLQHFENLRRAPGEDILSQLVNADRDDRMSDLELRATALLVLGAGFETTVNLLGNAVAVIGADEKSRARLAAEPDLWAQAVDEMLRYESPVQLTGRIALKDTTIDGVDIAAGTAMVCLLGAANRDPAVFENPHVFDLDRPNSREHVAFSAGIHYCLGANLAKMEGQLGLRLLFERYPDLELIPGAARRRDLQALRGYESLRVRLNA
jgi:hypothetical protein